MLYSLLLKLSALTLTAHFSAQAQAAAEGRGRWWLWLLLLLIFSLLVAWLLGRESDRGRLAPAAAVRSATEPPPAPPPAHTLPPTPPATHEGDAGRVGASTDQPAESPATPPRIEPPPASQAEPAPASVITEPDDLTKIEGIGPKIKQVLHEAGVRTFSDLAGSDVSALKQVLVDAGLRIHNPATWPEQATLAAAGKWDELKSLQSQLSAGRRA
ncbi:MAG: hypothetical protein KJZ93_13235 [Caldilineaceae bacterium]|nr:hypothetical protein [Caldilineaceae bacterium]